MNKNDNKQRKDFVNALSLFSQIGVTMVTCVIIGVFLGKWLDGFFGISPWFLLIFSFLGIAAAFKALFDLTMHK